MLPVARLSLREPIHPSVRNYQVITDDLHLKEGLLRGRICIFMSLSLVCFAVLITHFLFGFLLSHGCRVNGFSSTMDNSIFALILSQCSMSTDRLLLGFQMTLNTMFTFRSAAHDRVRTCAFLQHKVVFT